MSEDVKEKVVKIISDHRTGILSSVEDNKPNARYMTFYNKDLTLYTPTKKDTEKIEEIEKNPHVSVLLGYESHGLSDAYVEVAGTAAINDSQELKSEYWDESYKKWFDSVDDPNYVFIQIQPETVRIMNMNGEPPQEITF